ncbi:putative membrane protein [Rhodoligotrophos appendicifer]|uniref:protoporphyrinogen oxidase HemJ n=1 Tax=Rhodoligotrophos appendicifer TaxID=987056 RepID=UPI00117E695F|nr:protoporphyrinogen oxidase HemJ [Rhodoligotrophos appendicifer]
MAEWYPWLKAFHIIFMVSWMAGLLYLPRLFVYHCGAVAGSDQSETFKIMERRLYRGIMGPSFIGTWLFGLSLAYTLSPGIWSDGWFHMKLTLVIIMSGVHGFLGGQVKTFAADGNRRSARFFRIINEVPAVILVIVVILVVVKPF